MTPNAALRATLLSLWIALAGLTAAEPAGETLLYPKGGPPPASDQVIFTNNNPLGVFNAPSQPTRLTITKPCLVTQVLNYHWNNGKGSTPGTITLKHSDGTSYGPYQASGKPGQNNVANVNWVIRPNVVIKPGAYTVIDSNPSTWSRNSRSGEAGISEIRGTYQAAPPAKVTVPNVIGLSHQAAHVLVESAGLALDDGSGTPSPSSLVSSQSPSPGTIVSKGATVKVTFASLVTVPNLIGLTHAQAHLRAEAAELRLGHAGEPPGSVLVRSQYPASGSKIARLSTVTVTFENRVIVPALKGLLADEARHKLKQLGLVFVPKGIDADEAGSYQVTGQTPPAGTAVAPGSTVIVEGKKSEEYVVVPNVVGLEHSGVHLKLENIGLSLSHEGEPDDSALVEGQEPKPGKKVLKGSSVFVVFRDPPQKVAVPDIVNMSALKADEALKGAGLRMSPAIPEGNLSFFKILTQDPPAGTMVLQGAAVAVTTAIGRKQFSYADGHVVVQQTPVNEYHAELTFEFNQGRITNGRLYARPVCDRNVRQFGAEISFTGTSGGGSWENTTTTITGVYTSKILGCEFGKDQEVALAKPRSITITLRGDKVIVTTTDLYFNNYIFDAQNVTVQAKAKTRLNPVTASLLGGGLALLQTASKPDADERVPRTFGKVSFQMPKSWTPTDSSTKHEQTWILGDKESPEATIQLLWAAQFDNITDRMGTVEVKTLKLANGQVVVHTGLGRGEPPQRGQLTVFDLPEQDGRKFAVFAFCDANDWLKHQPVVGRVVESVRWETSPWNRIPTETIAFVEPIPGFDTKYRYFAFSQTAVVTDPRTGQQSQIGVGDRPTAADAVFRPYLAGRPEVGEQLGQARSAMRAVLGERLKMQVFEGGALIQEVSSGKYWASTGERRTPVPPRPGQLAVFPFLYFTEADYEVIACRDHVVVRDRKTGKEQTVRVTGKPAPVSETMNRAISKNQTFLKLAGEAVSPEAALFAGTIHVQVFEGGVALYENDGKHAWQLWHTKRK